ncbi:MAG TPA: MFS transporter [bacterium]|nr:MFS transporter [bacterium]HOC88082.1 MFS transporter [bacterium]HOZ22608.1 MFS transporter [bacterium]
MWNPFRFFATGPDAPRLTDQDEIDRRYRRQRLSVMLAITLTYGIAYTCRLGLSVVKKPLIDGGIFSAEQLGLIGSGIFYGYAFGKLVNGFLADHANIKKFLATGILMSALINIAMGWSTLLWVWVALWALNGWFQGFGAPAGIVSLSQWFSNRERGRYYGLWSTAHSIGEGLTFVGSAALVAFFGWQAGFIGPGLLCVLVAVAAYIFVQDRPQTLGLPAVAEWRNDFATGPKADAAAAKSTWRSQISILKMPSIWILALASATMYMTRYGMNSWGMLFLQEARGFSDIQAGGLLAMNPVAGIAGCAAYGFISDKLFGARRPPVNLICAVMEIASLAVIFFMPGNNPVLLTIAFLAYGFSINGLVTSLGGLFAVDISPKKAAGAAMGFIGVFSYLGAAIQERVSGTLIGAGTTMVDGVRHYDFSSAIWFWLGSSAVSLILAALLWRVKMRD